MAIKIFINLALIILLCLTQVAFVSGLPGPADNLNLILVILVFILGFIGLDTALWWSVGAGLMLEILSFSPFGVFLISLSLTVIAANFLLNYFFTNRSLYSFLALTALTTIVYELIINLAIFIFTSSEKVWSWAGGNFWLSGLTQIGLNLLLTFLIFYLIHWLGKNLKPVFLIKNKS